MDDDFKVEEEEALYGMLYYHYSSGPNHPITIAMGPLVQE